MKKFIYSLMFVAASAAAFTGCSKTDSGEEPKPEPKPKDAPTAILVGGDIDAVHEIEATMSVKVKITAPGGIKAFTIDIDSPALTEEMLGSLKLSTHMDLINPASPEMAAGLKALGFPAGAEILNATEQMFDISMLVPMIKTIYKEDSNHNFKLTIKDNADQSIVKTLKFHLSGASTISYNEDADLWKNTATLKAVVGKEGDVTIEYKKKSATDWQKAEVKDNTDGTYTATIAPAWTKGAKHPSGSDLYTLDGKTGIFAGNAYECRLLIDGKEITKGEFTTVGKQEIPFSNMNTWSKYIGYNAEWAANPDYADYKVDYPNESADNSFWGNGNNAFTLPAMGGTPLCSPALVSDADKTNSYAHLQGCAALGSIYAAGNLFSGVFDLPSTAGYARFGQKYEFTARPIALKVRVKATITKISIVNGDEEFPIPEAAKIGNTDPARIFVCITDWSDRHSVYSGMQVKPEELNAFDPVTDKADPAEGKVIGYGSKTFTENVTEWTELILPINWKDQAAKPSAGKYSLVISCASSAYGDYLCGSPDNVLCVDDFEWVY